MREAADALRLTAQDLNKLGIADHIIPEPVGGAQRGQEQTIKSVGKAIEKLLAGLSKTKPEKLLAARRQKYLGMGSKALV